MGREANIHSIRALEKQIEEGKGDAIKLKRTRNSLLNISTRVPPEILGYIFVWSLVRPTGYSLYCWHLEGLQKGSYNFLLVCHHWFEVASRTPELWGFWGNTLQDWKKRHHRSGTTPLDLVLGEYDFGSGAVFDESLQDAVRNRAVQDTIRQVHLLVTSSQTLTSILSSLAPEDGRGRNDNIESFALQNDGILPVDVSNFFARSRLSKLRYLDLYGNFSISSWDFLAPRTTLLTVLSLDINVSAQPPTAAQLFSILAPNPNLRELLLSEAALPNDADTSAIKVQLRHLKLLSLAGKSRHLFGFLHQLVLPDGIDDLYLTGSDPTENISESLAEYMQDYIQRDPRLRGRLGITSSTSQGSISITVAAVRDETATPVQEPPQISLTTLTDLPPPDISEQFIINLIALVPQERVAFFSASIDVVIPDELYFMMPNIETLHLSDHLLFKGFLQPDPAGPHANAKLLPSLQLLRLEDVSYRKTEDWDLLLEYLAHQTSDNQRISLELIGNFPKLRVELVDGIKELVEEFTFRRKFQEGEYLS